MLQGQMANERIVNSCASKTRHCWTQCQDKTTKMHFANKQMGIFIWGRVYGLGKIGRGKVSDSLQEYSPLRACITFKNAQSTLSKYHSNLQGFSNVIRCKIIIPCPFFM